MMGIQSPVFFSSPELHLSTIASEQHLLNHWDFFTKLVAMATSIGKTPLKIFKSKIILGGFKNNLHSLNAASG